MSGHRLAPTIPLAVVAMSLLALAAVLFDPSSGIETVRAQEGSTATSTPTGELVVVPGVVQVGQTTLAVGLHVAPLDTEVEIHYSEHFTPEGQACDGATPGATQPAAAPTWVTLNACSVGDGYVRLVASGTEHVIEEVSVTITPRGVVGQAPLSVALSGVTSADLIPGGSKDDFSVSATGLSRAKTYELNTVVLNGISAAFNRGCTNFKETETIRGATSATSSYDAYGCAAPGSYLWAWVEEVGGNAIASSGLTDHFLNVADPTVGFSRATYDVNEGSDAVVTVNLSHPTGHTFSIPVTVTADTAESEDYSVSGLANGKLAFEPHDTSESFTVRTNHDRGCENERIELSLGDPPPNVSNGSQDDADIVIADDEICVMFGSKEYSVNEGSSVDITVKLSKTPGHSLRIPVKVGPRFERTARFSSNATSSAFTYFIFHDTDCADEEIQLSFGTRPTGVVEGSQKEAKIAITDDDRHSAPVIRGPASPLFYSENGRGNVAIYRASASCGRGIEWSLSGTDAGDFNFSGGELTFKSAPDFENPIDSGRNNVYEVTVSASDGDLRADSNVTVTVTNVNEWPFVDTEIADRTMTAGASTTIDLYRTFGDPDGTFLIYTVTSQDTSVVNPTVSGSTLTLEALSAGSVSVTVVAWDGPPGHPGTLWVVDLFDVTVEELPPDIPTNLATTTGDGTITLDWDDAARAASYEVQQWDGSPGNLTWRTLPFAPFTLDGSTTTVTIADSTANVGGLTNGTSYAHRVRSVNSADESDWTTHVEATPMATLSAPTNLIVSPLSLRRAELSWDGDARASGYEVEVRNSATSTWRQANVLLPVSNASATIILDSVWVSTSTVPDTEYGMAHLGVGESYEYRVRAVGDGIGQIDSTHSDIIRVIDNPLLTEGGSARASGKGEARLEWIGISHVKAYSIRHRRLGSYERGSGQNTRHVSHDNHEWPERAGWPYYGSEYSSPVNVSPSLTSTTIRGLPFEKGSRGRAEPIYAFQFNYETTTGDKVFSARDAFVWPSGDVPANDSVVGTYTFFGHHRNREFEYIICRDTFPPDDASTPLVNENDQWVELIKSAFGEWATSTDNFITMTPRVDGVGVWRCSEKSTSTRMSEFIMDDDDRSEVRMLDAANGLSKVLSFPEVDSDVFKLCVAGADACVTSFSGYSGIGPDSILRRQHAQAIDACENEDLLGCNALPNIQRRILLRAFLSNREAKNEIVSVDVTFNQESFVNPVKMPASTQFNTCLDAVNPADADPDNGYKAYRLAVHEAGHALGLSNFSYAGLVTEPFWSFFEDVQPYEAAHPTIPDAVMNYDKGVPEDWARWAPSPLNEPDCSPHPFDIMAIYALYQADP